MKNPTAATATRLLIKNVFLIRTTSTVKHKTMEEEETRVTPRVQHAPQVVENDRAHA
jgi:hypothetical protein